jgi:hypothetical protein
MKVVVGGEGSRTLLAMVYSMAKMYKTSLMLGAPPSMRPLAFLDTDRGARLRLNVLGTSQEERDRLGIIEKVPAYYGPWIKENIDFYYPELNTYYGDLWEFATKVATSGKYKTVIVDTMSRMGRDILTEIKGTNYGGGKRVTIQGPGGASTTQATPGDYGLAQTRILEFIQALDDSPCHVLLTSHEKTGEIRDADTVKRVIGGPSSIGTALLETLPAMMDIVLRFEMRNKTTVLRTLNHNIFVAGDRGGLFKDGSVLEPESFWGDMEACITSALDAPKE